MAEITASLVKELREISGVGMMDCKKALVEAQGDLEAAKELLRKSGQAKALKKSSRETKEGGIGFYVSSDKTTGGLVKIACETDFVAKNDSFQNLLSQLAEQVGSKGSEGFVDQPLITGDGTVQDLLHKMVGELGENIQFLEAQSLKIEQGTIGGYVHTTGKIGVLLALETDKPYEGQELEELVKNIAMHVAAIHSEAISEDQIPSDVLENEKKILIAQAKESGKPDNIIEKMIEGRIKKFKKEICILDQSFVKNPDKTIRDLLDDVSKITGVTVSLTAFAKFQF